MRSDDDMGILISNRFLLNEVIAPKLICGLLKDVDKVDRTNINAKVNCTNINDVRNYFAYPLRLIQPIPRTILLPTISAFLSNPTKPIPDTPPEEPNAKITRVSAVIPPGDSSFVRITVRVEGEEIGYKFTATITADLVFSHRMGKLELLSTPAEADVDVRFEPWVYALGIALGLFSPLIGGAIAAAILIFLADIAIDPLAAEVVENQDDLSDIGDDIDSLDSLGSLLDSLVLNRVILDDLYLGGNFRITHDLGAYCDDDCTYCDDKGTKCDEDTNCDERECKKCKCSPILTERKCVEFEEHLVFDPEDLPKTIQFGESDVATLTENDLQPVNETRFVNLGEMQRFQSDNISQGDLRDPALNYTTSNIDHADADITLSLPDIPYPNVNVLLTNLLNDVYLFEFPVIVIGVQTATGQYGCLIVWHDVSGQIHVIYRAYRQLVPSLHLMLIWPPELAQELENTTYLKSLIYSGQVEHGYQSSKISKCYLISSMSNPIGLPTGNSIAVGSADYDCQFDGIAVATPVLLREPIEPVSWAIIRADGAEKLISPDGSTEINVAVGGVNTLVAFKVSGENNQQCRITSKPGQDINFTLKATVEECSVHTAKFPIFMNGKKIEVFGFVRWLEEFEKLRAFIYGEFDDGRGPYPDPLRDIILEGDLDRTAGFPERFGYLNREIQVARADLTAEEFLRLNAATDGRRGIQAGDTVRRPVYMQSKGRMASIRERTLPTELVSESANECLQQIVSDTFDAFRTRFGDNNQLRLYEKKVQKRLDALPSRLSEKSLCGGKKSVIGPTCELVEQKSEVTY